MILGCIQFFCVQPCNQSSEPKAGHRTKEDFAVCGVAHTGEIDWLRHRLVGCVRSTLNTRLLQQVALDRQSRRVYTFPCEVHLAKFEYVIIIVPSLHCDEDSVRMA